MFVTITSKLTRRKHIAKMKQYIIYYHVLADREDFFQASNGKESLAV